MSVSFRTYLSASLAAFLLQSPLSPASALEACHAPSKTSTLQNLLAKWKPRQSDGFQCPDWIKNRKNLPPCPKGPATLPETYPKAFTLFSGDANPDSIVELVLHSVKSQPEQLPVFAVDFWDYEVEALKTRLREQAPGIPWERHLVSASFMHMGNPYIRDVFHTRVDSKNQIEAFQTSQDINREIGIDQILEKCGIGFEKPELWAKNPAEDTQTRLGGNFLTLLPGIHVSTQLTALHKKSGWTEKNTLLFPQITNVSHIDEILQPLKTEFDSKGCPRITALISDPDQALKLLRKQAEIRPEQHAFDDFQEVGKPGSKAIDEISRMIDGPEEPQMNGFHQICREMKKLPDTKALEYKISDYQEVIFQFGEKQSKMFSLDEPNQPLESLTLPPGHSPSDFDAALARCQSHPECRLTRRVATPIPTKPCASLNMREFYQLLQNTDYNRAEAKVLREETARLRKAVEQAVSKKYPRCQNTLDWIPSPVILKEGSWALPNPTNSLPVTAGSAGLPDPYIRPFKEYLEAELTTRGIQPTWFDTLRRNNDHATQTGNLHCMTHSIPICGNAR